MGEKVMKVLLTGGPGKLGHTLMPMLLDRGDTPVIVDVRPPRDSKKGAVFIEGSILDRPKLPEIFRGCDCIVHIAAWHGIHEDRGEKNAYDFFDLNVRGTFEVFEAAASAGIDKIIFISTTSVYRPNTLYGRSKILAELIAEDYRKHRHMNVITLRPRGFIPHWDRDVYARYSDWARWFWKGAVHIDDVAAAVILSLDFISRQQPAQQLLLTLDSAYEYTDADLAHWDAEGPGSTFRKYYPEYYDLALSYGLDPALKPIKLDISETVRWLRYKPSYSLANLLSELAAYGGSGPPQLTQASKRRMFWRSNPLPAWCGR
jgi:nucleoside-diphosphate-sugar epimerase